MGNPLQWALKSRKMLVVVLHVFLQFAIRAIPALSDHAYDLTVIVLLSFGALFVFLALEDLIKAWRGTTDEISPEIIAEAVKLLDKVTPGK